MCVCVCIGTPIHRDITLHPSIPSGHPPGHPSTNLVACEMHAFLTRPPVLETTVYDSIKYGTGMCVRAWDRPTDRDGRMGRMDGWDGDDDGWRID